MICESGPTENLREVKNCRGKTSLEHIGSTTLDLAVFDIKRLEVMATWKRADERSKGITQTHEGKVMKRDVPNLTRMQMSAMFKSDILLTDDWFHFPPPFLVSTPIIFVDKLEGDSICLCCKFVLWTNPT